MRRTSIRLFAALAAGSLLVVACSDDKESTTSEATTETTAASETTAAGETTTPMEEMWMVDTADCVDPDAANAPIEGEIHIGSVMPLSGPTSADEAFAPVKDGWLAYMDYANENQLLGDLTIVASVEDDQYDATLTPGAVSTLLDDGVDLFSGIIGSPNNAAVRGTLNEECVPQLANLTGLPAWGDDAEQYPWTTGELVPYPTESRVYMKALQDAGITKVGLFYVNTDFGQSYADTVTAEAADYGLEVVAETTVEGTDSAPPAGQMTTIADAGAEAIIAIPLGAGCVTFLSALADKKAQSGDWDPPVYLTNTCASKLILDFAKDLADGIYTSNFLVDVNDPESKDLPGVTTYVDYMTGIGKAELTSTATAGWTVAEITVAIIKQAMESPDGLTRASIINAARNFDYTPSLGRPGVVSKMSGMDDTFPFESLQILQYKYDAENPVFVPVGDLITDYESS